MEVRTNSEGRKVFNTQAASRKMKGGDEKNLGEGEMKKSSLMDQLGKCTGFKMKRFS